MFRTRFRFALALLPLLAACGELLTGDDVPPRLRLEVRRISAFVAESVEVTAVVRDARGTRVEGAEVTWTTYQLIPTCGWGCPPHEFFKRSLEPGVTRTDQNGRTSTVLQPPTSTGSDRGPHYVIASIDELADTALIEAAFPPSEQSRMTWRELPPMPSARHLIAPVASGDRIYFVSGSNGCPAGAPCTPESTWIFDPAAETWTVDAAPAFALPGLVVGPASAVNDSVHLIVGTRHHVYAPGTRAWSERAPAPADATGGALNAVQGKLYLISASSAVYAYDPANVSWSARSPMPTPRSWAASAVLDGRIYVAGGCGALASAQWLCRHTSLERYDPATDRWSALASMPFPRDRFGGAAIGGSFCVFGGAIVTYRTSTSFQEVYCFDPASNAWSLEAPVPYLGLWGASVVEHRGSAYVFGGAGWNTYYWQTNRNAALLTLR